MDILANLSAGLDLVTWANILALFAGVVVGIIVGAIPGMGVTMAVALALPFTFTMDPISAILLLVGLYKGGNYGGSISAILIATPGVPASSATILDGYPLNKQGKAGKALNMAISASVVADVITNVSLIFFAGTLALLALKFGPVEFCALIFFSLTIIVGVSGKYIYRGLLSGVLGLLAATVGADVILGVSRFTYGSIDLLGGLSFIPVIIGIFALPEIISKYFDRNHPLNLEPQKIDLGGEKLTWSEFKGSIRSIFRGSLIGVFLGAIPGIGAAPAAFLSYNEAKRKSKNKHEFGKGSLEGVAASEAGNNGTCGSTLIPLLTLGIPGDITTAVMLGAFLMQGLTPGPALFQEHGPTVYGIFISIILSSFMLLIIGKFAVRFFTKISNIPESVFFPIILALCIFGTYAVNEQMFDILLVFVFGIIGFAMRYFSIPPAPFLIGFILSPLFENNLRRSLRMAEGDFSIFFSQPISAVFIVLGIISISMFVWRSYSAAKDD